MKITKSQLRKIIKEEIMKEVTVTDSATEDWAQQTPDESGRDFMRRMSYEKRMRAEAKREYTGIVVANPLTGDLETDDAEIAGEYGPYHVRASSEEEAEEIILDIFHDNNAIRVLDDFKFVVVFE